MSEAHAVVQFAGPVRCRNEGPPLALTLVGRTVGTPEELLSVAFAFEGASAFEGVSLPLLPEVLESPCVRRAGSTGFRIWSGSTHWDVPALACHLHRDVGPAFYKAIAPRKASWSRRLLWSILLGLAAHPVGKRLLLTLRRR